jgi:hypothetical protein
VILKAPLKSFPDDLKFLRWDGFPQRSLPLDFCPENLVTLDMPHSHLEQLWVGDQVFHSKLYVVFLCILVIENVDLLILGLNHIHKLSNNLNNHSL